MARNMMLGLVTAVMLGGISAFGGTNEASACSVKCDCCQPAECSVCCTYKCYCPEVCVEPKQRCRDRCTSRRTKCRCSYKVCYSSCCCR
jgi:hypothetical protein